MFVASTFIWHAVVGEILVCEREPNNFQGRYAVAIKRKIPCV